MSFTIYKISTWDTKGNTHAINRHETWEIVKDQNFLSLDDATEYIKRKNINLPYFKILIQGMNITEIRRFCEEFMNDPKYLCHLRYFIGKPPIDKIRDALIANGICVE